MRQFLLRGILFCGLVPSLLTAVLCHGVSAQPAGITIPNSFQKPAKPVVKKIQVPEAARPGKPTAAQLKASISKAKPVSKRNEEFSLDFQRHSPRVAKAKKRLSLKPEVILRHLTNNIQGFRLPGEIASLEWPVFFTQAQVSSELQFKIGYLTAVSVMPEASRLKLIINDVVVGVANILETRGSRSVLFDIPPGLIRPGFNSVRISAEQRHRVDCSLVATFELWTQIDPTRTGFIIPKSDPGVRRFSEIAALPPDEQGALPIRIVSHGKTSANLIERSIHAVQRIVLYGRFEQPVIDIGPLAYGSYGINVVIGTIDKIAPAARRLNIGAVGGPRFIVIPAKRGIRTSIVITGRTDKDLENALLHLRAAPKLRGSPEGLRAINAYPGYRVKGGQRVKLRDMGIASEEFSGRMYRAAFNVIMPPDFYAADYGKAFLDLAGGYAPGLTNAAQIVISVNGKKAVSQKLPKTSGDVFKQSSIPLRLGHLRPGLNRIEIEAQVPTEADKKCDPMSTIGARKRFLLLDTTELVLPRIARIARAPDLVVTTTGGFPFSGGKKRPILFVPKADASSVAAAATVASHLAIAAGQLINFRFTTNKPRRGEGATLVMAPTNALDAEFLSALGLAPERIRGIWQTKARQRHVPDDNQGLTKWERITRDRLILQKNFPAACHLPKPPGGYKTAFMVDRMPVASIGKKDESDLFSKWDQRVRSQSRIVGYFSGFVKSVSDWARGNISGARVWLGSTLDRSPAASPINDAASLIIAQNILGESSNDIWTLITAPNTSFMARAMGCLVDPRVWQQIAGRVAVLNTSDAKVSVIPVTSSKFIATQSLSIQNLRLIVAGWFSLNSKIYVLSALLLALLLAASTSWFIRNSGRKPE